MLSFCTDFNADEIFHWSILKASILQVTIVYKKLTIDFGRDRKHCRIGENAGISICFFSHNVFNKHVSEGSQLVVKNLTLYCTVWNFNESEELRF